MTRQTLKVFSHPSAEIEQENLYGLGQQAKENKTMSEEQHPEFDLAQELREMGEQLKRVLQAARDHPQTKDFERQVSQAMKDLGSEIERAVQSAKSDENLKRAGEQVKQAAQSLKESGAKEDLERGLAKGVRTLNEQLQRALEELEKASKDKKTGD